MGTNVGVVYMKILKEVNICKRYLSSTNTSLEYSVIRVHVHIIEKLEKKLIMEWECK